jgi:AraC-like DNA-binding protein
MKNLPAANGPRLCWGGRFSSAEDVAWHSHAETELVLVTSGSCEIEVGERRLAGAAGALFVLPAEVAQFQHTYGPVRTTFIGLRVPSGGMDESARVLTLAVGDPATGWLEQLCDWPLVQPPLGADLAGQLLSLLLRRIRELDAVQGTRAQRHPAVAKVIAWVEENPAMPCTLDELAKLAGVSASHLGALFTAETGGGPLRYVQRRRLERAAWLLENPYLRVHEVAAACGYEDVNYFVRLFRREHGAPPGRWRKVRPTTLS